MSSAISHSDTASLCERDLLGRFVHDQDGDAFAEIVRRHQSTVQSVCQRVLTNQCDVEDAFQATFLTPELAERPQPGPAPERSDGLESSGLGSQNQPPYVPSSETERIIDVIYMLDCDTQKWIEVVGEGGSISQVGDLLIVHQNQQGHRHITRLLNVLAEKVASQ